MPTGSKRKATGAPTDSTLTGRIATFDETNPEFNRFARLTKSLVTVPKKEIDAKRKPSKRRSSTRRK